MLGPGLSESAYEECLCHELSLQGVPFERQVSLPVVYKNVRIDCGYRPDILVDGRIIVELKAVDAIADVHKAQLLTYLQFQDCWLGLPINFNVPRLVDGVVRLVSGDEH